MSNLHRFSVQYVVRSARRQNLSRSWIFQTI